jgi:hypothetical protein
MDHQNTATHINLQVGAAVVDGKIYAIGRYNESCGALTTNLMYDPATYETAAHEQFDLQKVKSI